MLYSPGGVSVDIHFKNYNRPLDASTDAVMATAQPALTECPVCSEHYTDPKLLPCAHRLCRRCVVSWVQLHPGAGHPTCPLCRRHISTVSAGTSAESVADQLPSDESMTALVKCTEALEGPNNCAGCGKRAASDFCHQCWEKYCPSCSKLHTNMALGRNHTISALSAVTPQDLMASRRRMCETHPSNQADLFCGDHQAAICVTCSTTSHRKCDDIIEVKSEGGRKRRAVRDKLTELQKMAETHNQTLKALKRQKSQTDVWYEGERQRVTAVRQRLLKALDAGIDKMMTDINRAASSEHQEIQSRIDALSDQLGYLGNQIKLLEEEEAMAADCDLVTMGTSLLDRVASLTMDDDVTSDDATRKYFVAMFDEDDVSCLEKELVEMGLTEELTSEELIAKVFQEEEVRVLVLHPAFVVEDTSSDSNTQVSDHANPAGDVTDIDPEYEFKSGSEFKVATMSVGRGGLPSWEKVESNMEKALTDLSPGLHAVIWVVPVLPDCYSATVKAKFESLFVDCYQEAWKLLPAFQKNKLFVNFLTHGDESELDVEEYLSNASQDIRSMVQEVRGRWFVNLKTIEENIELNDEVNDDSNDEAIDDFDDKTKNDFADEAKNGSYDEVSADSDDGAKSGYCDDVKTDSDYEAWYADDEVNEDADDEAKYVTCVDANDDSDDEATDGTADEAMDVNDDEAKDGTDNEAKDGSDDEENDSTDDEAKDGTDDETMEGSFDFWFVSLVAQCNL